MIYLKTNALIVQPVEHSLIGQFQPQGEQTAVLFRLRQDGADETVQPLRPQIEGEQLRIVLFQDKLHCRAPSKFAVWRT